MRFNNNQKAFFALLQAGLWEKEVRLAPLGTVDYQEVMRLSEEQSVVGLVTAGLEHVVDMAVPKVNLLQFIGQTLQIEEQNKAMNYFIGVVVDAMRKEKIHTTLIKGQGVAQCYERPLWRTSGDVDFFLDEDNYDEAKVFFAKMCSSVEPEKEETKHIGFTVDPWLVELHATMHFGLSKRVDRVIDEVRKSIFQLGGIRTWHNEGTDVFLPDADNDIIIVFTHFLGHFLFGGVGLKQMCDVCRLVWTYKDGIRTWLLKQRLNEAGLMSEWKVFAAVAVDWLGMPAEVMPFYDSSAGYRRKARRAFAKMMKDGNMGHNTEDSGGMKKLARRFTEYLQLTMIFPLDAHRFFVNYLIDKVRIRRARKRNK